MEYIEKIVASEKVRLMKARIFMDRKSHHFKENLKQVEGVEKEVADNLMKMALHVIEGL